MRLRVFLVASLGVSCVLASTAQTSSTRTAILIAEDKRAPTPRDLTIIRGGLRSEDPDTARIAVRALGRLENPALIPDIVPSLRAKMPEVRAEAANAIGQAAQGFKSSAAHTPAVRPASRGGLAGGSLDGVVTLLLDKMADEPDDEVRAAMYETLGRLPYSEASVAERAESGLVEAVAADRSVNGRLGIAKALEAFVRINRQLVPPSEEVLRVLRALAAPGSASDAVVTTRVRRLALEGLIGAGGATDDLLTRDATDLDWQVRVLVMRAVGSADHGAGGAEILIRGMADASPRVRFEALRALHARKGDGACQASLTATSDHDPHVALLAIDQLAGCGSPPDAVSTLEHEIGDRTRLESPRGWHRVAHALVALASAAPERAQPLVEELAGSNVWQIRMYAARAAGAMKAKAVLERLARDPNDNVVEAAVQALSRTSGHDGDAAYIAVLGSRGYQAVRAAVMALAGTPTPENAGPPLERILDRLNAEDHDNSRDVRKAIVDALTSLAFKATPLKPPRIESDVNDEDLNRFASARARITIRGLGSFELALVATEAPATVLRFARLANEGYYNGLTFHRVVPNFVIQGGSPAANEYVGFPSYMRDEVGRWPHVRGAVGISTRGRDTGDAQIFVDLVDNPRLDHQYTVFAQVVSGIEIVDQVLEGDVIERVDIL